MAENRNAQQVREITDKLEQGIKELFESERFKEYLRTMSKFYNYSFNNTLLIAMQKPEATYVAGYTSWQRNFDRQVMKGEKGIKILAPAPYKSQEEREKIDPVTQKPVIGTDGKAVTETVEVLRPAFKVVSVFDVSLSDQEKLVAIMEAGCDEVSDIDDLINLTFNLDCYDIMPGINDESDLGYYYAHEAGIYSEKDLGPLANYIDYERYGRDIAMDEQGRFTDEGYVRVASERWDRQFNGEIDDIPDEYRITGSGEAAERDSTIAVLIVEPGKKPYVKEIDSDLKSLQHEVGGWIEAIYPYEDPVALVCNEEGKLEGLPLNRALRDEDGDIYDVVAGTFLVVGLTDDSFGSLTVEQMHKFSDHFKVPEQFVKLGDKIVAIPMISKEQQKQEATEQKDFEMNADTSGLTVAGHIGTWHTIDQHEVGGHSFYLMEHDTYGDEAACIIVDERGKLVLDDVYNGFDDDTLRLLDLEVKEVPEMPDPALSVQDMKDYGYAWAGVLPAGQEAAEKALEKGCEVYRLYSDNTEGLCVDAKEIADHAAKGGMLGISKESWMAALEKENYLKAAEMSMEDDYGMIDGIINNGPKEDKTAEVKAPERGEKSSIMDRLKSAKAEKQKECCPPKKHKGEIEL